MEEVLNLANGTVETGRRFKRQWRIGNKVLNRDAGTFTDMLGWARSGPPGHPAPPARPASDQSGSDGISMMLLYAR